MLLHATRLALPRLGRLPLAPLRPLPNTTAFKVINRFYSSKESSSNSPWPAPDPASSSPSRPAPAPATPPLPAELAPLPLRSQALSEGKWTVNHQAALQAMEELQGLPSSPKEREDLLRLKYDQTPLDREELSSIEQNAQRLVAIIQAPMTPSSVLKKARVYVDKATVEGGLAEWLRARPVGESSVSTYLRHAAEHGLYQQCQSALDTLRTHKIPITVVHYTTMLVAILNMKNLPHGERTRMAEELRTKMELEGIRPDPAFVTAFLNVLVTDVPIGLLGSQKLDKAFEAFKSFRDAGIPASTHQFTTLIKGCVRVHDWQRAWATFDHMRTHYTPPPGRGLKWVDAPERIVREEAGICEPDVVIFTSMIHVCAQTGEAEKALNLLDEIRSLDLYPTEATFNALLSVFALRPDMYEEMFRVLNDMKAAGYAPDALTMKALLQANAGAGDVGTAALLFDEVLRIDPSEAQKEDIYVSLLTAHARGQRKAGVVRTKKATEILKQGEAIWERLLLNIPNPSVRALNARLALYAESDRVQRSLDLFLSQYKERGLQPNLSSYALIIRVLSRTRRLQRALDLLAQLEAQGLRADLGIYSSLILSCAKLNFVTSGMQLLRQIKARNLPLLPHFHFVLQFRRNLISSPHLVREIDQLTGKAKQPRPGWLKPGGRKQKALGRILTKKEVKALADEPKFPLPAVHGVSSSAPGR